MRIRGIVASVVIAALLAGCSADALNQSVNNLMQSVESISGVSSCQSRATREAYAAGRTAAQATSDIRRKCGSL